MFKPAFLKHGAIRDVLTLASGRFGAAIISFLAAPFIARLFLPSEFGVAALFIVVVTLVSQLLPLAYQNAIVVPKKENDAIALSRIAIYSSIVLAGILYMFLWVKHYVELPLIFTEQHGVWEWLIPVTALMLAFSLVCEAWLTRKKGFVSSAKASFSQAVVTSGGRLSLGSLWGTSVWGLILPYVAGVVLRLGILMRAAWCSNDHNLLSSSISNMAKEYAEFPKYNLSAGILRTLSDKLPILVLAPFFGASIVGLYAMADRLIKTPLTMGAMSVRRVYLQRASVIMHRSGDLKNSYLRTTGYLAFLGIAPLLFLMLVGEPLLTFVLGVRWLQAGEFVEILAPLMYLMLISRPAAALVDLLRQQRLWLRLQIGSSLLRVLSMLIAWQLWTTVESVIWGFVLGAMPAYIWIMYHIWKLLDVKESVSG